MLKLLELFDSEAILNFDKKRCETRGSLNGFMMIHGNIYVYKYWQLIVPETGTVGVLDS